jgi:hypothetical protein
VGAGVPVSVGLPLGLPAGDPEAPVVAVAVPVGVPLAAWVGVAAGGAVVGAVVGPAAGEHATTIIENMTARVTALGHLGRLTIRFLLCYLMAVPEMVCWPLSPRPFPIRVPNDSASRVARAGSPRWIGEA